MENKTGKYFKYAIGEIILVVIGILIALQINNWKESKRARLQEVTILKNIKGDITLDTLDLVFNINYHKRFLKSETQLLNFLQSPRKTPLDSINYNDALGLPMLTILHKSTFSNLQNNDIGLISNNELYKEISRFYDFFAEAIGLIENDVEIYETYDTKKPYFKSYFKLSRADYQVRNTGYTNDDYFNPDFEKSSMVFGDIEGAKIDEGFKIELNESILMRQVLLGFYMDMLNRIKTLIHGIDQELDLIEDN